MNATRALQPDTLPLASTLHVPHDPERGTSSTHGATGRLDQYEPAQRRGYRALLSPLRLAASNASLAVGTFTTTTAWLAGIEAYKVVGPPLVACGALAGLYGVARSSQGTLRKTIAAASMMGLATGCGLYQWALLGGPAAVGAVGMALLLGCSAYQAGQIGGDLAAADRARPLPLSTARLQQWMPWVGAASLVLVGGGGWFGALGLGLHREITRVAGEACLVLGAALGSLAGGLYHGRFATHLAQAEAAA